MGTDPNWIFFIMYDSMYRFASSSGLPLNSPPLERTTQHSRCCARAEDGGSHRRGAVIATLADALCAARDGHCMPRLCHRTVVGTTGEVYAFTAARAYVRA